MRPGTDPGGQASANAPFLEIPSYNPRVNTSQSACELIAKKCVPWEGGVAKYSPAEAQLVADRGWQLTHDATRIRRDWELKNFREGIKQQWRDFERSMHRLAGFFRVGHRK